MPKAHYPIGNALFANTTSRRRVLQWHRKRTFNSTLRHISSW